MQCFWGFGPGILPPVSTGRVYISVAPAFSDITGVVSWQNFDANTGDGPNGGTGRGGDTYFPSLQEVVSGINR